MAGILHAVAGGLYTAAILVHDTRLAFVVKALPWIMSSTCWGVLELLVSFTPVQNSDDVNAKQPERFQVSVLSAFLTFTIACSMAKVIDQCYLRSLNPDKSLIICQRSAVW